MHPRQRKQVGFSAQYSASRAEVSQTREVISGDDICDIAIRHRQEQTQSR